MASVLSEYQEADAVVTWQPVTASGGFSGASVWRITAPNGQFALRRVPAGQPPPPRRAWLHRFLRFVRGRGLEFIAAPLTTRHGATFVERGGASWELAPWLPGAADFHRDPRPERLAAAMSALARFHLTAAVFPGAALAGPAGLPAWSPARSTPAVPPAAGPSPGLADRLQLLQRLRAGEAGEMRQAIEQSLVAAGTGRQHDAFDSTVRSKTVSLAERAFRLLDLFEPLAVAALERLQQQAATPVPLQPCLRDVWHNHVLFTGDRVTGLIDYDAIRIDSVAGDLARLLGSLVEDDRPAWAFALAEYSRVRPMSPREAALVEVFDLSSIALSGTQWVRWLYLDQFHFSDMAAVADRMDHWIRRGTRFVADGPRQTPRWE